jgi:hypothetical protein
MAKRRKTGAGKTRKPAKSADAPRGSIKRLAGGAAHVPAIDALVARWTARGDALLAELAKHGIDRHEVRANLKECRFLWIAPDGSVSAEAPAWVVCSWSRATATLVMAWVDPLLRGAGIPRIEGCLAERDDTTEEQAWRVAMEAADACRATYLYRLTTPHALYFLALGNITFSPSQSSFHPTSPVGLVLRGLIDTRQAIASRAEPATVVRDRLVTTGTALLGQAGCAYRDTDWVARLERTGKRLLHLAQAVPRPSYGGVAAGQSDEWLERDLAVHLLEALALLEDEWHQFL